MNDALQFKYVLEFFDEHLDFINKAPCFWTGVITSIKYSMLMQAARLFDESKDATSITLSVFFRIGIFVFCAEKQIFLKNS